MSLKILPEQQFTELVQRLQKAINLLLLIVSLVAIDSLNHNFRINQYLQQLPAELYEFASKYESALLTWHDEKSASVVNGPVSIRFEKVYRPSHSPTPGYISVDSIPFLETHLRNNLPELATGDRSLFGYQMDFILYFGILLVAPSFLLLIIIVRLWLLRRAWHHIPERAPRLMTDILSLRSFRVVKDSMVYLTAILISLFVLLVALLPPFLVTNQILAQPVIRGSMSLNPVGIPLLDTRSDVYEIYLLTIPDSLSTIMLLASLFSLLACSYIAILLIKQSPSNGDISAA